MSDPLSDASSSALRQYPILPLKHGQTEEQNVYFAEELKGWTGYIEWEKYPAKKARVAQILAKYQFVDVRSPGQLFMLFTVSAQVKPRDGRHPLQAVSRCAAPDAARRPR